MEEIIRELAKVPVRDEVLVCPPEYTFSGRCAKLPYIDTRDGKIIVVSLKIHFVGDKFKDFLAPRTKYSRDRANSGETSLSGCRGEDTRFSGSRCGSLRFQFIGHTVQDSGNGIHLQGATSSSSMLRSLRWPPRETTSIRTQASRWSPSGSNARITRCGPTARGNLSPVIDHTGESDSLVPSGDP